MYYDVEMLKLYFKENNFTREKINRLLDENPFNEDYIKWEKQTRNNNKTLAIELKKNKIIKQGIQIQEITNHEYNNIGMYLNNDVKYTICNNDYIGNIKLEKNLILIKGYYDDEYSFLKKIEESKKTFVAGICTKNYSYYEYVLRRYQSMLKYLKDCELFSNTNDNQYISILKNN